MNPATKTCPTCRQEFARGAIRPSKWPERIFCSKACQDGRLPTPPEVKTCPTCAKPFRRRDDEPQAKWRIRGYCSRHCAGRAPAGHDRRRIVREPCEVCRKQPRRRCARTCSDSCATELRRRNALRQLAMGRLVPPPARPRGEPKPRTPRKQPAVPSVAEAKRRDAASMPARLRVGETLSLRALRSLEQECTSEFRARVLANVTASGDHA